MKILKISLLITPLFFFCELSFSQTIELRSGVINNGYGTSSSGTFQLSGTVGEIIGGPSTSSNYELNAGSMVSRIASSANPGLVAHYPLDGDLTDASGNEYDAFSAGTLQLHPDVAGLSDRAYYFDGAETYVGYNFSETQQFDGVTLSAWVYLTNPNAAGVYQNIMALESGSTILQLGHADNSYFLYFDDGNITENFTFGTPTDGWHHVVATWDGTNVNAYVDGEELGPLTATSALMANIDAISIGADRFFANTGTYGEHLDGVLDEIKIFNYGLTAAEVLNLYNSYPPTPQAPQNLVAKVIGPGSIELSWTDGPLETFYSVYWDDQEPIESGEVNLAQNETSYTITGLTPGVEYYIAVAAGNDLGRYNETIRFVTPINLGPIPALSIPFYSTLDETVTIQYFTELSYPAGEMDTASTIFMHAGLITPENEGTGEWSDTIKLEMTFNLGAWEATMTPRSDFGVPNNFVASDIALFFTNADSSAYGYAADLEDVRLPIFNPANVGPLGGFVSTDVNTDISLLDANALTPPNLTLENLSEFTIEALVNYSGSDPTAGDFNDIITRGFQDGSNYTPYHGVIAYNSSGLPTYPTGLVSTDISGFTEPYVNSPLGLDIDGQSNEYQTGTWAHIAMIYTSPGNLDLYVNGIFQESITINEPLQLGNILKIGNKDGGIDELRFWNYSRSQEDIRFYIDTEIDPSSEGLIGYWKMNEIFFDGTNDVIEDETTSQNDLVVANGVIDQLPDLEVTTFALNPKSIAQEENLTISYTVANNGAEPSPDFDIDFYLSTDSNLDTGTDIFLSTISHTGLLQGESLFNLFQTQMPNSTNAPNGDYFVIAVLDIGQNIAEEQEDNNMASRTLNINSGNVNTLPSNIGLTISEFPENLPVGSVVGYVTFVDPDDDLYDYDLVAGTGDTDNALFSLNGSELVTNAEFNFEADKVNYSIRVQVDDRRGTGTPSAAITLTLTDENDAPTDISLTPSTIIAGTNYFEIPVGDLETVDEDNGDLHTYQILVEENPDASFLIVGNELSITVNDPVVDEEYFITIQSTDQGGLTTSKELTITVVPAGIAPSELLLTNNTINENQPAGATIGQFIVEDVDSDTFTYAFVTGGADNSNFAISSSGALSQVTDLPENIYSIRVSATDDTGLSITRTFTIEVIDNDTDVVINISGQQSDYRIISVPFSGQTIGETFTGLTNDNNFTEWRMFGYSNGNLNELKSTGSQLTLGNGYWFITTIAQEIELAAGTINTNPTIGRPLSEGWNLIGNPYLKPLNWTNILDFNGNPAGVDANVSVWNGGWNSTPNQILDVMQGGYVFVQDGSAPSNFQFYPSTASTGTARVTSSRQTSSYFDHSSAWQLFLNLESDGKTSNISGVGLNESSIDEKDKLDRSAPPTPAVFDALQLTEKATGLTKNIKAVNKSVFWDFTLTGADESTTISWDQSVASMLDEPLMIALLPQGDLYDMSSMSEITFTPEENQSVMVVYGKELPKELLVNAITAYPNPAEQEVNFKFYVDVEGMVPASVELYNLSGKQLGTINQMTSGGQWNEINYKIGTQDLLKSGIYLFKVRYQGFESVMKKLIVR